MLTAWHYLPLSGPAHGPQECSCLKRSPAELLLGTAVTSLWREWSSETATAPPPAALAANEPLFCPSSADLPSKEAPLFERQDLTSQHLGEHTLCP